MASVIDNETISTRKLLPKHSTKRMQWVDYARGLAIILVVYRHSMVGLKRSGIDVPAFLYNIQEFLVNVRMPIFFVLSGIFLGRSILSKPPAVLARKKLTTLLYPYLVWTVILITIQIGLSDMTNSKRTITDYWYIIAQPRELDHMWYLLALFNTSILLILASRWLLKWPALHILIAVIMHIAHFWVREYSLVSDILYYYIFLAVGVHVSNLVMKYDSRDTTFLLKASLLILPLFIAGQLFWLDNIDEKYAPVQTWYLLPFLAIILIACLMFYCVCRLVYNAGIAKWLNTIGKASLYIYILHILVISSFRVFSLKVLYIHNVYFIIGGSLILGIILPVIVYFYSLKWKPLHYMFSLEKPQKANG